MKVANLITGVISGLLMLILDAFPLMTGIAFTFADAIGTALNGLDGCFVEEYYHGFHILVISILVAVFALMIMILSIISSSIIRKKHYQAGTKMNVVIIAVTFVSCFMELYLAYWENTRTFMSDPHRFLYFWPVAQGLLLVLMVVFTIINYKKMKDEVDF